MKYWFFDGNDVVGPFEPRELAARADFSVASSLVCPEKFSEDEDSWKTASSFADFGPDALSSGSVVSATDAEESSLSEEAPSSAEEAALFDKEMDTFLKNPSILAGTAAPAPEGPGLEIPKKPAKPGPIEDYFNNINGEDLGDILGIPDPNEISDMNLPRVVDGKFEHTNPPTDKEIDFVEADADEEDSSAAAEENAAEEKEPATLSQETSVTLAQESADPLETAEAAPAADSTQPLPTVQPVKREEPVTSVPISAAEEEDLLVVLPGQALPEGEPVLEPETDAETASADADPIAETQTKAETKEHIQTEEPQATAEPVPAPEPAQEEELSAAAEPEESHTSVNAKEEQTSPVCGPAPLEEETLSTCTLPLIGERESAVSLPAMPEDDAPFVPAEPVQEAFPVPEAVQPVATAPEPDQNLAPTAQLAPQPTEEVEPASEETPPVLREPEELVPSLQSAAEEQQETQEDPKAQTVRDILRGELSLPPEPEELKEPLKTVPMEPQLNQVKPKLNQTPEIERFLTSQSETIRRARNHKANVMLWVLAGLLALGVIFMLLRFLGRPDETVPAVSEKVPAAAVQPAAPTLPARNALEPVPTPPPAPLTAADKALAAVQNHQLPGGKGTIASYFDRIYKTQLSQGYTGDWSAEALHKNTYIVKYRLSKTRMEPIVYVFQADAAQGKLTGALNNIALDLVGKI